MKTYWATIRKMEELIENGDATLLKKFIDLLQQKNLLNKFMLTALCETSTNQRNELWGVLQEFGFLNEKEVNK